MSVSKTLLLVASCLAVPAQAATVARPVERLEARPTSPDRLSSERREAEPRFSAKELEAYRTYNDKAAARSPKLAMILADPDRFVADLKGRFEQQKALTPEDPYAFDFSDYGIAVLSDLKKQLDGKIDKVGARLDELKAGTSGSHLLHPGKIKEYEVGLDYLKTLSADVGSHLGDGKIGYRRLIELSYFGARAMGHFDHHDLALGEKLFLEGDRILEGHRSTSIAEERRRYDHGEFAVFDGSTPVHSFTRAQGPFEKAFFDKEKMDLIALPTTLALDGSELMRLVPYNIFLVGVTDTPIAADGFVRPGADFWLHDIRHSTVIFEKRREYDLKHDLSPEQSARLQKEMDVWKLDLDAARAQVTDPDLGNAIDLVVFNTHHDRGLPIAPSSFTREKIDYVPQALYAAYRLSGQSVPIKDAHQTMARAYQWLRDFWTPRAGEETALWVR